MVLMKSIVSKLKPGKIAPSIGEIFKLFEAVRRKLYELDKRRLDTVEVVSKLTLDSIYQTIKANYLRLLAQVSAVSLGPLIHRFLVRPWLAPKKEVQPIVCMSTAALQRLAKSNADGIRSLKSLHKRRTHLANAMYFCVMLLVVAGALTDGLSLPIIFGLMSVFGLLVTKAMNITKSFCQGLQSKSKIASQLQGLEKALSVFKQDISIQSHSNDAANFFVITINKDLGNTTFSRAQIADLIVAALTSKGVSVEQATNELLFTTDQSIPTAAIELYLNRLVIRGERVNAIFKQVNEIKKMIRNKHHESVMVNCHVIYDENKLPAVQITLRFASDSSIDVQNQQALANAGFTQMGVGWCCNRTDFFTADEQGALYECLGELAEKMPHPKFHTQSDDDEKQGEGQSRKLKRRHIKRSESTAQVPESNKAVSWQWGNQTLSSTDSRICPIIGHHGNAYMFFQITTR